MNNHNKPPTTIEEVGIHIGYISEDIKEIKQILADSPSRKEFDDLKERVDNVDAFQNGLTRRIAGIAAMIVLAMVLALYGLDRFL